MTPKEQAAIRQAIEFIVDCEYGNAELALREALAEQACPNGCDTSNGRCVDCPDYVAEQAEQKPVGMVIGGVFEPWNDDILSGAHELYAAPVRTKDLTDDEIDSVLWIGGLTEKNIRKFARAVITADREKNK